MLIDIDEFRQMIHGCLKRIVELRKQYPDITTNDIISFLFTALHDRNETLTKEFQQWLEDSSVLFENEVDLGIEYKLFDLTAFARASLQYKPFFYVLYKQFCNGGYSSPQKLLQQIKAIVKGKTILEVGCGPGYNLKILQDFGAHVVGVDPDVGRIPTVPTVQMIKGKAQDLPKLINGMRFDLAYSHDLFCEVIMSPQEVMDSICAISEVTALGGYSLHQFILRPIALPVSIIGCALDMEDLGHDLHFSAESAIMQYQKRGMQESLSNETSMSPMMFLQAGFQVLLAEVQNESFTIFAQKR